MGWQGKARVVSVISVGAGVGLGKGAREGLRLKGKGARRAGKCWARGGVGVRTQEGI